MAYSSANPPKPVGSRIGTEDRGSGLWLYTDSDILRDIDDAEYFADGHALGMQVNDVVNVVDTSAHVATRHVVNAVVSGGGATIKRVGDIGPYFAFLDNFKHDSEEFWDDAFQRAYSFTGGRVGRGDGPRTLILPAPAHALTATSAMTGGIRITQTIKMNSQTHLMGHGGLETVINCRELLNLSSADDFDGIHFGFPDTTNHYSTIQHIRLNNAPRNGISTYKSGFGENAFWDNVVISFCGSAGFHVSSNTLGRAFKPLRIGAINMAANKYGLHIDGEGQFRSQAYIGFVSGDNQLKDLIRVDGNPGLRTTALHIDRIKCEISDRTANENVVNLRSGSGGVCTIGSIYQDCIASAPHATATYRCINVTEDTAVWRVAVGGFYRTDNSPLWDDELAFDDGNLSLTWEDVQGVRLDQRFVYRANSWSAQGQDGVDERIATTQGLLRDKTNNVNSRKYVGKRVYDITNNKPVYADGVLTSSVWVDALGSAAHTPV